MSKEHRASISRLILSGYILFFSILIFFVKNPLQTIQLKNSMDSLHATKLCLKKFHNKYKSIPNSFSLLKKFCVASKFEFSSFDSWGTRLKYIQLDQNQWYLKSFGPDREPNSFEQGDDIVLRSLSNSPYSAVTYKYQNKPHPYPFNLLIGSFSPDKKWYARIYIDPFRKIKQLIVLNKENPTFLFVAPHDAVTSFYWRENSREIIFTATGSARYGDGLFVWDLKNRSLKNMLSKISSAHPYLRKEGNKWFLFLAGINAQKKEAYVYAKRKFDGPLPLKDLIHSSSFWKVSFPKRPNETIKFSQENKENESFEAENILSLYEGIDCGEGSEEQRSICSLANYKLPFESLEPLQNLTEKMIDSPTFPFLLWELIQTYQAAFSSSSATETEKETLKNYALELSRLLAQHLSAPPWLQHMAWDFWIQWTKDS